MAKNMQIKLCYDLMEIIEKQDEMIRKQNELIAKLTNENMEKENMINELMQQEKYLYLVA